MTTDVRAIVIKSSNFGFLWDGDDGGAFEARGDFTQLQWSVEDLCEDGGSWSAQDFRQTGVTPSGPGAFLLFFFLKTLCRSSSLICSAGVGDRRVAGGVNGVQIVCQLLILHSAGGWWWCLSYLSTLKQNHWKMICSLAYQNNSSLTLWSPFPVCIWPVYTRLYIPFL